MTQNYTIEDIRAGLGASQRETQTYNEQKLINLMHYVVYLSEKTDGLFGAIKLNKILWFCDRFTFRKNYQTISTLSYYIRRENGPMIPDFYPLIKKMEEQGLIKVEKKFTHTFKTTNYQTLQKPDFNNFTDDDKNIIEEVADAIITNYNAEEISDLSHDICWRAFDNEDQIPIGMVLLENRHSTEELFKDTRDWAYTSLQKLS